MCTVPTASNDTISLPSSAILEEEPNEQESPHRHCHKQHPPFSKQWVVARLKDSPDEAIPILRNWSHNKRYREINKVTVDLINQLEESKAIEALDDLRQPHTFVRGSKGRKLSIISTITTLDTRKEHQAQTLIDCGCEGSCVHQRFVDKHRLNVKPLARPIPVFNADGTPNKDGPITGFVSLQVKIGEHVERIDFGVTNLGRGEIFLGFDWLSKHNPSIDWVGRTIKFDRCPSSCPPLTPKQKGMHVNGITQDDQNDEDVFLLIDPTPALQIRARTNMATELAIKEHDRREQRHWKEIVPEEYHEYEDVFTKKDFDELPPHRPWDHAIELLPGTEQRLDCKIYPLSRDEQEQLDEFLEEQLRTGRIRPSQSPMASPFFFVKKKDGRLRPVQDYRKLNNMTVKNRYPLPLIAELIDTLKDAKYFTKLDVRWGYNNVRIKEGDEHKAAFRTNRGLFEPLVMFFGLTNSPATFQTMMNDVFHIEIMNGHLLIYLDDILILDTKLDEHHKHVKGVLRKLRENKLYLKPEKCEFDRSEIEYLGVIVGNGEVKMDPVKTAGIGEWPIPTCKRDVQSFLGFCNFYRRFIHHFADIARPLNNLTGNTPFSWTADCQTSFDKLKTLLTSDPILIIPNDSDKFRLEADASKYAAGAVLSQQRDGKWRPVGYSSDAFNSTQRNYDIYDRELLAIMIALEKNRKQLIGTKEPFEIQTDHANLQYFKKPQKLNRRQARWFTELQDFNFVLTPIPGKHNSKADILSRRPGFETGAEDNDDTILLPESLFISQIYELEPLSFTPRILRARNNLDQSVKKALEIHSREFKKLEDGTITYRDLVCVPKDKNLRADIISQHHDTHITGHPGTYKTIEQILRNYWWPTLHRDTKRYIAGCETCQRTKPQRVAKKTPLHPFEPPQRPWETITLDLVGPLPESQGCNAILTIVDWLSKAVKFEPTHMELNSAGFARILRDRVFRDHGLFRTLIHDRDTRFTSDFIAELLGMLGIEQNPSTAYHPQTDGQSERTNQTIEQYLRIFVDYLQDDWKEWLPLGEFAINNSVHAATKQTPFFVNYGQHPWTGLDVRKEVHNESAQQFADRMKKVHEDAAAALRMAAERMKRQFDRHARASHEYQPGDKVYLSSENIRTPRPSKKLDDKWFGPFEVQEKIGRAAYRLKLPPSWKGKSPVFNEMYLKPYRPPEYDRQRRPPPPPPIELEDGEKEWEVEAIVDSRRIRGKLKYLVHWKGYSHEDDTWEDVENVEHASRLVDEFHKKYPRKPSPTNRVRSITVRQIQTIHPQEERLFNPRCRRRGIDFKSPTKPMEYQRHAMVALGPDTAGAALAQEPTHKNLFTKTLPKEIEHVWIYETQPVDAITSIARLDKRGILVDSYLLLDPIEKWRIRQYIQHLRKGPAQTPPWMIRDHFDHKKHLT